jgi:hypothetical protein
MHAVQDTTPPVARPTTLREALRERREARAHHALDRPPAPFRLPRPFHPNDDPESDDDGKPISSDYFLG